EDCEPLNGPTWCLLQAQSPDNVDQYGIPYGAPLTFDRPIKAVFSPDGGTAYVLNCGPECGGSIASVALLPTSPMVFQVGQQSGKFPATGQVPSIPIPGGASNALITGSTMYVVGQCPAAGLSSGGQPQCATASLTADGLFAGNLTIVNLN